MGFFQEAGRKVEKLKQSATSDGGNDDDQCPACGAAVPDGATECPECGATLDQD